MNNIKIWKFFVPLYGLYYLIKVGRAIGFRTPLPVSHFQGIFIGVSQAIWFAALIVTLIVTLIPNSIPL